MLGLVLPPTKEHIKKTSNSNPQNTKGPNTASRSPLYKVSGAGTNVPEQRIFVKLSHIFRPNKSEYKKPDLFKAVLVNGQCMQCPMYWVCIVISKL